MNMEYGIWIPVTNDKVISELFPLKLYNAITVIRVYCLFFYTI